LTGYTIPESVVGVVSKDAGGLDREKEGDAEKTKSNKTSKKLKAWGRGFSSGQRGWMKTDWDLRRE